LNDGDHLLLGVAEDHRPTCCVYHLHLAHMCSKL
jgi:hypothetical protein